MSLMTDEQIRLTILGVLITWGCLLVAGIPTAIILLLLHFGVLSS